ncbi:peroxisome assembly protein 12 [Lingula anatina]|uniref:Peroxisome assembly protein 12 n=1 Tax=Lingula anatina TaxID=7574 RepID=A0A1S3HCG2_LINAN|nr:peroxisome assembly protein 12 [Lingula anatina]|eukprot:XP_013383201.1 peroxisome assembly protein 12 [Lingula anatina]
MAEFAAHLTSAAADDKPSIFEVLAQENLMSALRPALIYSARILAENNPGQLAWLHQYCDEIYLGLQLLVEQYHLKRYSASFAENFYGLKRTVLRETKEKFRLPGKEKWKSLFFLAILPYMKLKLDALYERWKQETVDGIHTANTAWNKLIRVYLAVYPFLNMSWEGILLSYQMLYVFGKSTTHSPFLNMCGVILQNITQDDLKAWENKPKEVQLLSMKDKAIYSITKLLQGCAIVLTQGISVGVFFLQFVEWWYASDQTPTSLTSLPRPAPPKTPDFESTAVFPSICPLCQQTRRNDTVLAVSGYVFCYPCVFHHLKTHHCCPVTGYPAETEHLIRLYLTEE